MSSFESGPDPLGKGISASQLWVPHKARFSLNNCWLTYWRAAMSWCYNDMVQSFFFCYFSEGLIFIWSNKWRHCVTMWLYTVHRGWKEDQMACAHEADGVWYFFLHKGHLESHHTQNVCFNVPFLCYPHRSSMSFDAWQWQLCINAFVHVVGLSVLQAQKLIFLLFRFMLQLQAEHRNFSSLFTETSTPKLS